MLALADANDAEFPFLPVLFCLYPFCPGRALAWGAQDWPCERRVELEFLVSIPEAIVQVYGNEPRQFDVRIPGILQSTKTNLWIGVSI